MSRTDRDMPWRLREEDGSRAFMLRGPGFRQGWRRPRTKAARRRARVTLAGGAEPEPYRHRHSALWDCW